jgi:cobaltochelatase CobT
MIKKEDNFKEKFKQALISTAKVISDDYKLEIKNTDKNFSSKNTNFFEIDNLSNKSDFIRLRAETDTVALKKKFSDNRIYKKNLPTNISSRLLYNVAEKIRYEVLGGKMLKGIKKNLDENYYQKINLKRKDQLQSKDDVPVSEAFELYMLKKFFNLKLNLTSSKKLSFWEKDFNSSVEDHMEFLNRNLENKNNLLEK